MRVAILGAGAYGTALGGLVEKNGHAVRYYDPRLGNSLAEALTGAEVVLLVTPSSAVPDLLPKLPKDLPLVVATKGIVSAEVFADFTEVVVVSGPGYADDIKVGKPTRLTVTDRWVEGLLRAPFVEFDFTADKTGVLICGALKNAYAILAGMRGLVPGSAKWERFIEAVLAEMRAVLATNGARPETVDLYCGRADLVITCGPPSRNYEFGEKAGTNPGYRPENTVEGIAVLERIRQGELQVPDSAINLRELLEVFNGTK